MMMKKRKRKKRPQRSFLEEFTLISLRKNLVKILLRLLVLNLLLGLSLLLRKKLLMLLKDGNSLLRQLKSQNPSVTQDHPKNPV